ncbi:unnamed protein product [Zymoseptoria tritici ST99CH_1A5]|uniref:Uncharacterized protein n=1 Tax=Zymoseptoria tritici ST99CH_1A5 TaxID=1276529 RepID=A0A1Y6LFM7_ZYMTR|nr:unnamed protein product [Zymoseptoria tritici ST99CH_1A5]
MSDPNPTSSTPEPCSNICCEPFFAHSDKPITTPSSLSNPISALFASSQFNLQSDPKQAAHAPAFNYAAIEPALRLASRFLTLDSVVKLIVVMADGDLRVEDANGVFQASTWAEVDASRAAARNPVDRYSVSSRHPKPEHEVVDDTMRRRAEEILTQIIPLFDIDIYTYAGTGGRKVHSSDSLPEDLLATFPRGRQCTVKIGAQLFWHIDFAMRWLEAGMGPRLEFSYHGATALSYYLFQFAATLVHELFHVLETAHNGRSWYTETFYGDSALSECGYVVEDAIFGGYLTSLDISAPETTRMEFCAKAMERQHRVWSIASSTPKMMLVPWPSHTCFQHYKHVKNSFGVRRNHIGPIADAVERIDMSFVEQLLSESFWAAGVGPGPLILPKVGGLEFRWCSTRKYNYFAREIPDGEVEQEPWNLW